jgi:hypothetical protein
MAKKTRKKSSSKSSNSAKQSKWTFPQNTLEECVRVAKVIEDNFAGKGVTAEHLVKPVGFNQTKDWRFLNLLRRMSAASVEFDQAGHWLLRHSLA